ncbi:hypothetical protein DFQ29_008645 [Apophysomyces sp. BC1021]|nr:hypothetical protein DFQ29_008645 [Apophysomyces sp. BC1021]
MTANALQYEIAHCSSWDDDFSPEQLIVSSPGNRSSDMTRSEDFESDVKVKGWQTKKCTTYPQDLIIHLLCGPARINKVQILSHHYKIATKIDVYIGVLKESIELPEGDQETPPVNQENENDDDDMLIEFTRLGYVCFDNNARAQYRARELKSIKINADGEYIRLVVRNCHQNKLNSYNQSRTIALFNGQQTFDKCTKILYKGLTPVVIYTQIGVVALNVLGQPIQISTGNSNLMDGGVRQSLDEASLLSSSTRRTSVSSNHSVVNNLSTSVVVEIELQQWISALLHAEEQAVKEEAYQLAKTYKILSDKLTQFARILDGLEIGKKQAVETKDYDEAEKIKADINEIKLSSAKMLRQAGVRVTNNGRVVPTNSLDGDGVEYIGNSYGGSTAPTLLDPSSDRIHQRSDEIHNYGDNENIYQREDVQSEMRDNSMEESTAVEAANNANASGSTTVNDIENTPEPIASEDLSVFSTAIQVFGKDIVACVLSVKGKCRERGLIRVETCIQRAYRLSQTNQIHRIVDMFDQLSNTNEHHITFIDAAMMMIQAAVRDPRENIVNMAIAMWAPLNSLCIAVSEESLLFTQAMERAFSALLKRVGDSNIRIRQPAVRLVLTLAQKYPVIPQILGHPQRPIYNHKEAKARLELLGAAVNELGISQTKTKGIIDLESLMGVTVSYINHSHEEVRDAALKLIIIIFNRTNFQQISKYMDYNTRASLVEMVQNLGRSSGTMASTPIELKQFASQLKLSLTSQKKTPEQPGDFRSKKKPLVEKKERVGRAEGLAARTVAGETHLTAKKDPTNRTTASRGSAKLVKKPITKIEHDEDKGAGSNVCIFCDEVSPDFNEGTLVEHYYNACPVLTNCPMCDIITEISTLNDHAFSDCEKRHLVKQCGRCKQPISVEQWLQHTLKHNCPGGLTIPPFVHYLAYYVQKLRILTKTAALSA